MDRAADLFGYESRNVIRTSVYPAKRHILSRAMAPQIRDQATKLQKALCDGAQGGGRHGPAMQKD
ncbi:MAG: hypothetical protein AAF626_08135 [Pseudomonadota bacterium]